MDPATAVGVASAAVTFLDFTIKICKLASQISSSDNGATKHNADLEDELNKFKKYAEDATSIQLGQPLKQAVDDCVAVPTELLALLEHIREAKDEKLFGTVKALYRSIRYRDKVATLQKKVEKCQMSLVQGLTQETLRKSILHHDFSTTTFGKLDKQVIEILAALQTGEDRQLELLIRSSESRQQLDDKLSALDVTIRGNTDRLVSSIDDLTQKVTDMAKPSLKEAFINSLYFEGFRERQSNVSEPCTSTFEWFFDREGGADPAFTGDANPALWHSFPRWLEDADSSQQYWLSGKAGSGKSTLMAQVCRDLDLTKAHLNHWSGSRHLCILSFFLFRAGAQTQVSLRYLLRSLLYQLIIDMPAILEVLMAQFLPAGHDCRVATWPVDTLKKMLSSAIRIADDCNFFVLIDGIDEYQGHELPGEGLWTAADLVDFLYDIQKPSHVKLCVSSRPETRIIERYPSFLETKLAMLNRDDIWIFVSEQLYDLFDLDQRYRVCQAICDRADEMFMWAVFAIREMKDGHAFEETYSQLLARLDEMTGSLAKAITQMLQSVAVQHRARVAFYLQVLGSWNTASQFDRSQRSMVSVALIAASRSNDGIHSALDFVARCHDEERDLVNLARGLIEVKPPIATTDTEKVTHTVLLRSLRDVSSGTYEQHDKPRSWLDRCLCAVSLLMTIRPGC